MTAARDVWHLSRDGSKDWREITIPIPLRTANPLNGSHQHWAVKARTRKQQRCTVCLVVGSFLQGAGFTMLPQSAVRVTIARLAPSSGLDDDNLRAALKAVRDGVADALGVDDRDARVTWAYEQRRSKPRVWAVEIRIVKGYS